MAELKGGCRCGKVTYATSADPIFVGVCHCRSCQKSTGTAYATVVAVPTPSLTVTGQTKRFDDRGDSGKATHRDFCPVCGSTITQTAELMEHVTMIPAGTLNDPDDLKPAMQIYCDSAVAWAKLPDIQSFPKMPG
jgi:hypothetical protein